MQPTVQSDASSGDVSTSSGAADLPPITLIAPPTAQPDGSNGAEPAMTLVTLAPATSTPVPLTAPNVPTITLQVITPGMSLGLFTPDATSLPTRTPVPGGPESTNEAFAAAEASEEAVLAISEDGCTYTVQAGDSLYSIAVSQNTTVNRLLLANPDLEGDPPVLQIDQELELPACIPGLLEEETDEPDAQVEEPRDLPEGAQLYTVQSGDVLGSIASRFGVTVRAIVEANEMDNPDSLSIGQELIIPAPAS
ncbi:MAG: LysM peptidoglycan-binding domain-containing protein [Chloroflexi bacterium]|nr:LysM peptidoglycan-binding domain-containing protein [Chloroflexota bacterium]